MAGMSRPTPAPVDLRSDTVTRPTAAMLDAMHRAEVGDDVFGDDPTVLRLQEEAARLLGKEAALLVPSGTMANQVAIRSHTEPGDEIVVEAGAHIWRYEGGAYAALSGVSVARVEAVRGILTADAVRAAIRPEGGLGHFPPTRLVCVEQSSNSGGGTVYPLARLGEIAAVARDHGLRLHMDGARLFNAAVALGVEAAAIAAPFDSVSFCLSKGLGCPVGSLVVGSQAFVDRAHRFRKMFGGGMRQAGYLAAAGLHALAHHVDRLADDHRRARRLGEALAAMPRLAVDLASVETNMVYVDVAATGVDARAFAARLAEDGVRVVTVGPTRVRAVTHLDVDDAGVDRAIAAFARAAAA
jgi:threonine aldolase